MDIINAYFDKIIDNYTIDDIPKIICEKDAEFRAYEIINEIMNYPLEWRENLLNDLISFIEKDVLNKY